jgi:hypothetical protein
MNLHCLWDQTFRRIVLSSFFGGEKPIEEIIRDPIGRVG